MTGGELALVAVIERDAARCVAWKFYGVILNSS